MHTIIIMSSSCSWLFTSFHKETPPSFYSGQKNWSHLWLMPSFSPIFYIHEHNSKTICWMIPLLIFSPATTCPRHHHYSSFLLNVLPNCSCVRSCLWWSITYTEAGLDLLKCESDNVIAQDKTLQWLLIIVNIKSNIHTMAYKTFRVLALTPHWIRIHHPPSSSQSPCCSSRASSPPTGGPLHVLLPLLRMFFPQIFARLSSTAVRTQKMSPPQMPSLTTFTKTAASSFLSPLLYSSS